MSSDPQTPRRKPRILTGAGSASPITSARPQPVPIKAEEVPSPEAPPSPSPAPKTEDKPSDSETSGGDGSEPDEPDTKGDASSESDSSSDEDMPTVSFTGRADTLNNTLTHCKVRFLARASKYEEDSAKCGYLASLFAGPALDWLTQSWEAYPDLLDDWDKFTEKLAKAFQASEETQKQSADQKLRSLRQTGAASKYALIFEPLVMLLGYNDEAKKAAFMVGLKPQVKQQLAGDTFKTYELLRNKAINIDESLFAIRGKAKPRRTGKSHPGPNKN